MSNPTPTPRKALKPIHLRPVRSHAEVGEIMGLSRQLVYYIEQVAHEEQTMTEREYIELCSSRKLFKGEKMKKIEGQFRQGDILIEKVDEAQKVTKAKAAPIVLAEGEATGHCHTLERVKHSELPEDAQGRRLVNLLQGTSFVHPDHLPAIPVADGVQAVTRQREYSPEAIRSVQD